MSEDVLLDGGLGEFVDVLTLSDGFLRVQVIRDHLARWGAPDGAPW